MICMRRAAWANASCVRGGPAAADDDEDAEDDEDDEDEEEEEEEEDDDGLAAAALPRRPPWLAAGCVFVCVCVSVWDIVWVCVIVCVCVSTCVCVSAGRWLVKLSTSVLRVECDGSVSTDPSPCDRKGGPAAFTAAAAAAAVVGWGCRRSDLRVPPTCVGGSGGARGAGSSSSSSNCVSSGIIESVCVYSMVAVAAARDRVTRAATAGAARAAGAV
jgi:hypothetical protein